MASTTITSIGQTGAEWYISGLGGLWDDAHYSYAYITIDGVGSSGTVSPPPAPGSGYTTGWGDTPTLSPGTHYTGTGYVYDASGGGPWSCGTFSFTTDSPPPPSDTTAPTTTSYYAVGNQILANSIQFYAYASDTGGSGMDGFDWEIYGLDDNYYDSATVYVSGDGHSQTCTFSGLTPGNRYYGKVRAFDNDLNYETWHTTSTYTTPGLRPSNWDWTTAQSGGAKVAGAFSMLATEWNAFTDRINAFRDYTNVTNPTYSFTTASKDMTFGKYMAQQAIDAIAAIPGRTVSLNSTTAPNTCDLAFFNNLRASLNSTP